MRFDFKALSDPCECGKEHKLDVRDIYLEPGALDRLPGVLSENQWNSPAILADENTWKAAGEKAYSLLEAEQIKCTSVILPPDGLHADEHGVALAEKDIDREIDVLLAVGSGTVHDITRYIANKCGLPFISIPTAASVDGFVSTVAAMTDKLCHPFITPGTIAGCLKWAKIILKETDIDRPPILLMHGTRDGICSVEGSREFAAAAGKLCTYREWEGLRHDMINEECRKDIADEILTWLELNRLRG